MCPKTIEELVKEQGIPSDTEIAVSEAAAKKEELTKEFEFIKASAIYTKSLRDDIVNEKIATYSDFTGMTEVKYSKYHAVKQYFRSEQAKISKARYEANIATLIERRRIINESLVQSGRVGDWGKDICGLPPLEITYPSKPVAPVLPEVPAE